MYVLHVASQIKIKIKNLFMYIFIGVMEASSGNKVYVCV